MLTVTAVEAERDAVVAGAVSQLARDTDDGAVRCGTRFGFVEEREQEFRVGSGDHAVTTLPGGYEVHRLRAGDGTVVDVLAAGVGPASAASGTATALTAALAAGEPHDLVISAGIAGGFPLTPQGRERPADSVDTVIATEIVAADLGAHTPDGFVPITELGFGTTLYRPPEELVRALARATGAATGPVLTVSTVTGSEQRAAELATRHPGAAAEAMEGFGVARAAAVHGVPVLEVRTVSNVVGPRDRSTWRVPEALRALTTAFETLIPVLDRELE